MREILLSFALITGAAVTTFFMTMFLVFGVSMAQESKATDDDLISTLISGVRGKSTLNWKDVFNGGKEDGKDMYLKIYQQIVIEPKADSITRAAQEMGMKRQELEAILSGDVTPIVAKDPRIPLEKALSEAERIQRYYAEVATVNFLKKDLEAQLQPTEMFANGDTSDSGFDLLTDLYRLEVLLFNESKPVDIGGNQLTGNTGVPGRTAIKAEEGGAGEGEGMEAGPAGEAGPAVKGEKEAGVAGVGGEAGGAKTAESAGIVAGGAVSTRQEGPNPNQCLSDSDLDKALGNFKKDSVADPRLRNQPAGGIKPPVSVQPAATTETAGETGTAEGETGAKIAGGEAASKSSGVEALPLSPAPASKWEMPSLCNNIICLTIDAKFKTATLAPGKANCVACHVAAINTAMKKLLSKSLIPGKMTGNLMEPAKCKEAASTSFSSLNMNLILIPNPVKSPKNDDLVTKTSMDQEWDKFVNRFLGTGNKTTKSQEADLSKPPVSLYDEVFQQELNNAPADVPLTEILARVDRNISQIESERVKALDTLITAGRVDSAATHYQALSYEIANMLSYFSSMKKIYTGMQVPCNSLMSKKDCS